MGYRPLETYIQATREARSHRSNCEVCQRTSGINLDLEEVAGALCQSGRKRLELLRSARESLPRNALYQCLISTGWEAYDAHECPPDDSRCMVDTASFSFVNAGFLPELFRIPRCRLGIKLADDRFERLGYDR